MPVAVLMVQLLQHTQESGGLAEASCSTSHGSTACVLAMLPVALGGRDDELGAVTHPW